MASNYQRSPAMKKISSTTEDETSRKIEYDDGRSYDPAAVHIITQNWIEEHMKRRESEFTESVASIIFCGTWNVNNKTIKEDGGLADWLCPLDSVYVDANGIPIADVYVVGFQEMVDLSVVNVAMDNKSQQRSQYWQEKIAECLESRGGKYAQVFAKHLVGLLICIFVKQSVMPHVRDVRGATAGVGVMGMMGNKGGASIRLTLFDSSLCFVCSHLAAHRENVVGRNNDFKNIIEKTIYLPNDSSMDLDDLKIEKTRRLRYGTGLSEKEELSMLQHDIIFWIGDLNYRIDDSLTTEEVFQRIAKRDISSLREKDQLNIEREKGHVFSDFNEGVIEFYPTYKYQPGTDEYETRAEKKLRAPAWCDRVLWKCEAQTVQQLTYDRSELRQSDHKPVMSLFSVKLRKIVVDKERAVFQELIKILDKNENDDIPKVEVDGTLVDFGRLKYMEKISLCITLRNAGSNAAPWRFVPKLDDKCPSKSWITLTPSMGIILPNQEISVTLSAMIDTMTADKLNTAREAMNLKMDLLKCCIDSGRHYYSSN